MKADTILALAAPKEKGQEVEQEKEQEKEIKEQHAPHSTIEASVVVGDYDAPTRVYQAPWAPICNHLPKGATLADVFSLGGLDWKVQPRKVYLDADTPISGIRANVRVDTGEVLGIVTTKHKIVQNEDAFNVIEALSLTPVAAGVLDGGRQIYVVVENPEPFSVLGDPVGQYLTLVNGHDGGHALHVVTTDLRIYCSNVISPMFHTAKNRISVRHMRGATERAASATEILAFQESYHVRLQQIAEKFAATKFNWKNGRFVERLFPLDDNATARRAKNVEENRILLRECFESDTLTPHKGTAWGAFMAVTDFVTHREPQRKVSDTNKYDERRFGAILNGDKILQRAVSMLEKISK